VKFGISHLLPERPDMVVAGINCGENSGLSAFYSGTVAAAREGAFWEIPSFAFSVCKEGERHMAAYAAMAPAIIERLLKSAFGARKEKRDNRIFYNVNFPQCPPSKARGIRATEQSMAFFDDRYETVAVETHPSKKGYVVYGEKKKIEKSNRYDSRALMNGYIAITPLWFDATHGGDLRRLSRRDLTKGHKK
jgi:5'-nucleotidase